MTKPGKERVKAWIYSVINPLLEGLRIESSFLNRRNWTFLRYNRDLEFIRLLEAYIDYQSRPNWEDFTVSNPQVRDALTHRDEQREKLRAACSNAFDCLVAMPAFQQRVSDSFAAFAAGGENASHLVHPNVKPHEVVAELVINNIGALPDHYALHRFWLVFRDDLMSFRVGTAFENADRAGLDLKNSNDTLATELSTLRSSLAEEYDVPWARYYDESLALPGR